MNNNSGDVHPVHTHRHTFEVTKVDDKSMSGLMKDTLSMPRFSTAEIDFIADDPGDTFFHCTIRITWTKASPASSLTRDGQPARNAV
jgi:FtsP/CotA-like multicopper oxidase with cupredoxin domain